MNDHSEADKTHSWYNDDRKHEIFHTFAPTAQVNAYLGPRFSVNQEFGLHGVPEEISSGSYMLASLSDGPKSCGKETEPATGDPPSKLLDLCLNRLWTSHKPASDGEIQPVHARLLEEAVSAAWLGHMAERLESADKDTLDDIARNGKDSTPLQKLFYDAFERAAFYGRIDEGPESGKTPASIDVDLRDKGSALTHATIRLLPSLKFEPTRLEYAFSKAQEIKDISPVIEQALFWSRSRQESATPDTVTAAGGGVKGSGVDFFSLAASGTMSPEALHERLCSQLFIHERTFDGVPLTGVNTGKWEYAILDVDGQLPTDKAAFPDSADEVYDQAIAEGRNMGARVTQTKALYTWLAPTDLTRPPEMTHYTLNDFSAHAFAAEPVQDVLYGDRCGHGRFHQ